MIGLHSRKAETQAVDPQSVHKTWTIGVEIVLENLHLVVEVVSENLSLVVEAVLENLQKITFKESFEIPKKIKIFWKF